MPDPVVVPKIEPDMDEAQRLTIFGARGKDQNKRKPRTVFGLILVAMLIVFMAGVAAMAAFFPDTTVAKWIRGTANDPVPTLADTMDYDVTPVTTDPEQVPNGDNVIDVTQIDPNTPRPDGTDGAAGGPTIAPLMSPEDAEEVYLATGIWQRAPDSPSEPVQAPLDMVYHAVLDPALTGSDPILLPDTNALAREPLLRMPRNPPAADEVFLFDRRGFVRATPQGTLTPQGVLIYSGQPPIVPPLRDTDIANALQATAEDAARADAISEQALTTALIRPNLRPENLQERLERSNLGGATRSELAAFRPALRPQSAQEIALALEQATQSADPDTPPSRLATQSSLQPVTRPKNLQSRAEKVIASAPSAAANSSSVGAARRDTLTPSVASGATVSRQATIDNALALNRVSLIGVSGTPSARRAMIRMPNAKIVSVKVGDRLDGGRVSSIGDSELRYTKSGRNILLKMPQG